MVRLNRKTLVGDVLSNKMDKTVVVAIEKMVHHPRFKKVIKKVTKLKAHDEKKECKVGDKVKLIESRPISKEKRWRVFEVLMPADRRGGKV